MGYFTIATKTYVCLCFYVKKIREIIIKQKAERMDVSTIKFFYSECVAKKRFIVAPIGQSENVEIE